MIALTNLAEWKAGWRRWLKEQEAASLDVFRGLCSTVFAYVVEETPEYTGESVANWTFNVGSARLQTSAGIKMGRGQHRKAGSADPVWNKPGAHLLPTIAGGNGGNPDALGLARDALSRGFRQVKSLSDTVWIANATRFDRGDFRVGALEEPPAGWLREVNAPGHMMNNAVSYVSSRFPKIDASNFRLLMVMPA